MVVEDLIDGVMVDPVSTNPLVRGTSQGAPAGFSIAGDPYCGSEVG